MDRGVILDTLNTVIRVQVLMKSNLEDGGASLTADDSAVGEEEDPDSVPLLSVGLDHVLLIVDPVHIPPVDGCRVMNTKDINVFDFKTSTFKLWTIMSKLLIGKLIKYERLALLMTQPREQEASAPGKTYLFIKRPLKMCQRNAHRNVMKLYQMRSSYCHEGRIPATWKTKVPSSSRRSYTWLKNCE